MTMDGKGRISLPSRLRDPFLQKDPLRKVFIVREPNRPCCTLRPYASYAPKLEQFAQGLSVIEDEAELDRVRSLTEGIIDGEFDEQWRLVIPPQVRKDSGLGSSVVAIGMIDRIELWDAQAYGDYKAAHRAR